MDKLRKGASVDEEHEHEQDEDEWSPWAISHGGGARKASLGVRSPEPMGALRCTCPPTAAVFTVIEGD